MAAIVRLPAIRLLNGCLPARGLSTLPVDRLQSVITPELCEHLQRHGYAVIDGVFGADSAAALRAEVAALAPHMHPNCTHLVTAGNISLLPKRHIIEAELIQVLAPLCSQFQRESTLSTMLNLHLPHLCLDRQSMKLQINAGQGGCFPLHFDTDASLDGRLVTAICYLNPDWQPHHGGHLRLYPFPHSAIDIEPLHDRMVLFSSQRMLHRVMPALQERYCFTIWLSESDQEALALLASDQLRQHAVKWAYREEWARSLEESHPPGEERAALLGNFWKEVGVIERALRPLLPALQRATAHSLAGDQGAEEGSYVPDVPVRWV